MQLNAAEQLKNAFEEKLKNLNLFYQHCKCFVTPRRLILFAEGLSLTQEDSVTERKGPRTDADANAIEGFLRSSGLRKDQLTVKNTPKGDFYFAIIRTKGKQTKEILKELLEDILNNFHWPKSMRWGEYRIRWVRPIQNIACVFGGEILPIEFGHIKANDISYGHRFLAPESFKIQNFEQFISDLEKRFVIADNEKRKKFILENVVNIAQNNGLTLIEDEQLLNEVTGLVEYPVIILGSIENKFMSLPQEVLISTIRTNQKYFNLRDRSGNLSPYFIVVSNNKTRDGGAKIIAGNEKVVRARLSDAEFFYHSDKEKGLRNILPKLNGIIFHNKIGTIGDKVERINKLAHDIGKELCPEKREVCTHAATLAKADLASDMVGEFPELQGLMGYYYALTGGESREVAEAIRDHYKPQGPNDSIPKSAVAVVVALADKIDSLVSLFAAGERATGSKDPFALRRLALGIIRIILENKISFELLPYLKRATKLLPNQAFKEIDRDDLLNEILSFFVDRIKFQLKNESFGQEFINAVLEDTGELNIFDIKHKVSILAQFAGTSDGGTTIEAYKRAKNILSIEEKRDNQNYSPKPSKSLLSDGAEKHLFDRLYEINDKIESHLKKNKFAESLKELTDLTNSINNYFDNTQINSPDKKIRENRLKLTSAIVTLFENVCAFWRI